VARWLGLE